MYYTYDQYLAYRKAKNSINEFNSIQPRESTPITFTNSLTGESIVFDEVFTLSEEQFALYKDWDCNVAEAKYPILHIPNFYEFIKYDVTKDTYKTRVFDIKNRGGNIDLLTPPELHYLQTGEWNV